MPESYTGTEGNDALADGMSILDGTEDRRTGYLGLNKTRDYIAAKFAAAKAYTDAKVGAISLTWASITGKPATFPPSAHYHDVAQVTNGVNNLADRMSFNIGDTTIRSEGNTAQLVVRQAGAIASAQVRGVTVAGWLNVGVAADGTIGNTSSSRRFKKSIRDWSPERAVLDVRLVDFLWKAGVVGADETRDHGVIAEEIADLGLEWAVIRDDDGQPRAVRYELLSLALIPIVRELTTGLDLLAQRLDALEVD